MRFGVILFRSIWRGASIEGVVVLSGVSIALSVESIGFTDISFVCMDSDDSFV